VSDPKKKKKKKKKGKKALFLTNAAYHLIST
jgi:hypothetical protein